MQTFTAERLDKTANIIINQIQYHMIEYGNNNVTLSCIYTSLNEALGKIVVTHSEIIRKKIIEILCFIREGFYTLKDAVYHLLWYILHLRQTRES